MLFTLSLPGRHGQTMQVFNALARLLPDTARTNDRTATSDVYELPIDYHPSGHVAGDEQFGIRIRVDPDAARAHFAAQAEHVTIPFDGYLQDREETARAMPDFASVCDRLQNHVHHFDHIGINVPAEIRQEDWCWPLRRVTGGGYLYEYPAGMDGYDPRENLWLFAVRNTERHLRPSADAQTKFEFVHDRASPDSLVQIDVQTDLSRTQAEKLFPEGVSLPGLADYFMSVHTRTDMPGMRHVRLDIRFAPGASAWASGQMLLLEQGGKRLRMALDAPAVRVPGVRAPV